MNKSYANLDQNGKDVETDEQRKTRLREKYKDLKSKNLKDISEELPDVLIEQILYLTRRMLVCGASKSRKTWLCLQIAFCLSKGLPLFGRFNCKKIPILFANLELMEATIKLRLKQQAKALGFKGDVDENIRLISASNYLDKIDDDFSEWLAVQATDDEVQAALVDPVWRLLGNREENSNTAIGQVLKPFARFSREAKSSAIGVHHFAKGSASLKEAIDVLQELALGRAMPQPSLSLPNTRNQTLTSSISFPMTFRLSIHS